MQPASDESADEILETLSNVNKGDEAIPNVTKYSEGDTPSPRVRFSEEECRNMSGHALMGRPAARLETMGFIDNLVCIGRCFI